MYFFDEEAMKVEIIEENKVERKIKSYGEEIMMVEVYFKNGAIGYQHTHYHAQTTYCLEGEFEFTVGEEKRVIKIGDSVYMPPDIIHGCVLLSDSGRLLDVFAPYREDFVGKKF